MEGVQSSQYKSPNSNNTDRPSDGGGTDDCRARNRCVALWLGNTAWVRKCRQQIHIPNIEDLLTVCTDMGSRIKHIDNLVQYWLEWHGFIDNVY
jgi:hypothetical protein